jgi:hypothetical protein
LRKILLLPLLLITNSYAIISIAQDEPTGEVKQTYNFGFSYGNLYGNSETESFYGDSKISFYELDSVQSIKMNFSYAQSGEVKTVDNRALYINHIQQESKHIALEYFGKFNQDEFLDIKANYILGIGARLKLDTKNVTNKVFLGAGAYHSWIEENSEKEQLSRLNNYFAYSKYINELITFHYNIYFQPIINQLDDYLLEQNSQLILNITKSLKLTMKLKHNYNSTPIGNIKKYDITQYSGISYKF